MVFRVGVEPGTGMDHVTADESLANPALRATLDFRPFHSRDPTRKGEAMRISSNSHSHRTTTRLSRIIAFTTVVAAGVAISSDASAQYSQRPGVYIGGNNLRVNPWNGSVHVPGRGVVKSDGRVYRPIGNGYYQDPNTGNKYNPHTGSYLQGSRPGFSASERRPGQYHHVAPGIKHNPTTGSTHIPGHAVIKPSGTYRAIGGGYYRDSRTGNVYNPSTKTYLRNW